MILHNQTGYIHPLYAASLAEFGIPCYLPGCGGWILERQYRVHPDRDAIGPYPLFFCEEWGNLVDDFEALKNQLVSISLVIGPFSQFPNEKFSQYFEIFRPYKDHYFWTFPCHWRKQYPKDTGEVPAGR